MKKKKMTFEITFVNEQGQMLTRKIKALTSREALAMINPVRLKKVS